MSAEHTNIISELVALCWTMKTTCIIQVGAEGGHEAEAVRIAMNCRAIAIDGDSRCSPCSPGLEYHYGLIGATDSDSIPFYLYRDSGLSSTLVRNGESAEKVLLPMSRLDTFCRQVKATPDALIIDTEGTTLDVLEGAGAVLDKVKMIYAEVQTTPFMEGIRTHPEVDAFLIERGFVERRELPSYDVGNQGNMTWVRT